jgi:hypothetical protein
VPAQPLPLWWKRWFGDVLTFASDTGIKFKVENPKQYEEYLRELEPIRQELGISLKEWMYPDN